MVTYYITVDGDRVDEGEITMKEWKNHTRYYWNWFLSQCKFFVHERSGSGVDRNDYPVAYCYVCEDEGRIIACYTVAIDWIITKYFREGSNSYQWCNYQRREKTLA